jgi:hypothetical protein
VTPIANPRDLPDMVYRFIVFFLLSGQFDIFGFVSDLFTGAGFRNGKMPIDCMNAYL